MAVAATEFPNGIYKVTEGDTLYSIVRRHNPGLSEAEVKKEVDRLVAVNGLSNPNYIVVDQEIKDTATTNTTPSTKSEEVEILVFGKLCSADDKSRQWLLTWKWNSAYYKLTGGFKVEWEYEIKTVDFSSKKEDEVWVKGDTTTIEFDQELLEQSTVYRFDIPEEAIRVHIRVKPEPTDDASKDKNAKKFIESWKWCEWQTKIVYHEVPPENPDGLEVVIKDYKLITTISGIDNDKVGWVNFRLSAQSESNGTTSIIDSKYVRVDPNIQAASASFNVSPGMAYYVDYRVSQFHYSSFETGTAAQTGADVWSNWTTRDGPHCTAPSAPSIKTIKAINKTEIYISWSSIITANKYSIRYANEKRYLESPTDGGVTTVETEDDTTNYTLVNLESGKEYFFQVRAINDGGESEWSSISQSVVIGEKPSPPTTWSSVSTAVVGETVYLYWVHNSSDGSDQSYALLEIDGTEIRIEIDEDDAEKGTTGMYELNTSSYTSGKTIQWRVRTAGASNEPSDWSIERTVNVYSRPTLSISMRDKGNNEISIVNSFPIILRCAPYSSGNQNPVSYNVSITANETYETANNVGNQIMVSAGTSVYSKHLDEFNPFGTNGLEIGPGDVNLENGMSYTVRATVFMDSGLTAEATREFSVSYASGQAFSIDARIALDLESVTTTIVPYCENRYVAYYKVNCIGNRYYTTNKQLGLMYRKQDRTFSSAIATTGETVYRGVSADDGEEYYYHEVLNAEPIQSVLLSVYRREFDGSFTELSKDLPSENKTAVTDPHPSLDYARYRIVAKSKDTGEISYTDLPAYEVGVKYVVIQWDEVWSEFDYSDRYEIAKASYAGSLLKLPYNIDVSDSYDADVTLVNYIGREHPVAYYGTQVGQTATWDMSIDKTDAETIYGLRRLARWMGNVYVREPSGSGYWARVRVSFNQKHTDPIAPVSLEITRVDGGA